MVNIRYIYRGERVSITGEILSYYAEEGCDIEMSAQGCQEDAEEKGCVPVFLRAHNGRLYRDPSPKETSAWGEAVKRCKAESSNLTVFALQMRLEMDRVFGPLDSVSIVGDSPVRLELLGKGETPLRLYLSL